MCCQDNIKVAMLVDVGRKVPPQLQALLVPMSTVGQECLLTLHPELLVAPPHTLQLHQRDVHAKVINLEGGGREEERRGGGRGEEGGGGESLGTKL